jgi:hypothetical protein
LGSWHTVYRSLSSVKLALALLISILFCCLAGVTLWRGAEAGRLIFSTLWFNGLLVLLVVNVGFCFFGRIWGRKVTLISFGMILFHLSFIAMFAGIIYNSMFHFRGLIRLTEGETLPNNDLRSYDHLDMGRFFDIAKFGGETTLIKMHRDYTIDGQNKGAAYEIEVGSGRNNERGILYITKKFLYDQFQFMNDREGYSLLIKLYDRSGRELYGAHVPLQSLKQKDDKYLYTTGSRDGPGSIPYPQEPLQPLYDLQVAYIPTQLKQRAGDTVFQAWPYRPEPPLAGEKPIAEHTVRIGERFKVGAYYLSAEEVRYWVMMMVRYEPGKPIVLASLWVGLSGMIITFIGRLIRGGNQMSANST